MSAVAQLHRVRPPVVARVEAPAQLEAAQLEAAQLEAAQLDRPPSSAAGAHPPLQAVTVALVVLVVLIGYLLLGAQTA